MVFAKVSRSLASLLAIFFCILTLNPVGLCQAPVDLNLDTGIQPNQTYIRGKENVNVGGGNLNIQIPIVQLPGRDGHNLDVSLTYNSQNWSPIASFSQQNSSGEIGIAWRPDNDEASLGSTGWQVNVPILYAQGVTTFTQGSPGANNAYTYHECWTNFVLVMGDGSKYSFPFASVGCNETSVTLAGIVSNTTDPYDDRLIDYDNEDIDGSSTGSGAVLDMTGVYGSNGLVVVRFRDGSKIIFSGGDFQTSSGTGPISTIASELVGRNGNVISIGGTTSGFVFTDTLGRQVTINTGGINSGSITYKDSNGVTQTTTLNYSLFPSSAKPTFCAPLAVGETLPSGCPTSTIVNNSVTNVATSSLESMLSSVVLPDGLSYTFQYNAYGEIVEITYPTGGYTRYAYQAYPWNSYTWVQAGAGGYADDRMIVAKYVCPSATIAAGSTSPSGYVGNSAPDICPVAEQETRYQRTSSSNDATTVIDPEGNSTSYTFGGGASIVPPFPTPPTGTLVNESTPDYPIDVTSRSVYEGSSTLLRTINTTYDGYLPATQTTVLPSGLESEVKWTYDTTPQSYSMSITDRGNTTNYDFWVETDNPIEKDEYGYGQGSPGALIRKTMYSYLGINSVNNVNYQQLPIYIVNALQGKEVYDGSENEVADTTYQYDSYATPIVASGAVQHGTSLQSYGTSYTTRGNVTSTTEVDSSSGGTLTTYNYEFDDAGNVLEKKDSNGNITTLSYADSWGNSTCAPSDGNAAAFVSSVTSPLGEKTQYTWNSCTGTMASVTDTNNQATTFAYDIMDRRVEASYPNTGQTCIQYSDAQNSYCPSNSNSQLPIKISTTKKIDSSTSATSTITLDGLAREVSDQLSSGYELDTTYDAVGNVASTSYDGDTTQYQYDALSRKVIQTQPDGSSMQWCYDNVNINSSQTICSAAFGNTAYFINRFGLKPGTYV